ncbi:MAG: tRNA (adenosine(37)-N6)-threonylcarbamoyltransferase complex transferase subunit TsaD [Thermomicrobiaceae bacterium]
MRILGIETSCDETSVAIVSDGRLIHANVIRSQEDLHERYGGVVPELASRRHLTAIIPAIDVALQDAGMSPGDIDAIAVTEGPGLAGSLLVGMNTAKSLALAWDVPLIPVNHLEGHIYSNWLTSDQSDVTFQPPRFPCVCLIVSGGHTELVLIRDHGYYTVLGKTIDDAAGEAFDKSARILRLGFPGGPAIQRAAAEGKMGHHTFPRAWLRDTYDFSFSGLKTALLREVDKYKREPTRPRRVVSTEPFPVHEPPDYAPNMPAADIAADFQDAIVDVLVQKTARAAEEYRASMVILAGGVASNAMLRRRLESALSVPLRYPAPILCTDNGAMIAGAGFYLYQRGITASLDLDISPQLPLVTETSLA